MKILGIVLQPLTILLSVALLVLIIIDGYTYAWGNEINGLGPRAGISLSVCTPWSITGCSQLWNHMGIHHKISLILLLSLIPLTSIMVLITSLAVFTRAIRKQTSIIILILISWIVFFTLVTSVILRISKYTSTCINSPTTGHLTYSYYDHWQIYITLASLIVSFVITQIFAFGGYFRPMVTMLTFEGHYQRYDYPRVNNLEKNMVSVKELDNF